MKMLGTVRWPEISLSASWSSAPSAMGGMSAGGRAGSERACKLTNLVQLKDEVLCAELGEGGLGGAAVRTVGLGEDGWADTVSCGRGREGAGLLRTDGVLVDDGLDLLLGGLRNHDGL